MFLCFFLIFFKFDPLTKTAYLYAESRGFSAWAQLHE